MAQTDVQAAAQDFIDKLDGWNGVSENWRELEDRQRQNDPAGTVIVEKLLTVARWLAEQVVNAGGRVLPMDTRATTASFAKLAQCVAAINDFDVFSDDSTTRFRRLGGSILEHTGYALNEIGVWACQHALRRADKPAGKIVEQLREAEKMLNNIRECQQEAEEAREGAKSAAAGAGAAVFADSFKEMAEAAEKNATKWLWIALTMAVLTVSAAWPSAFLEYGGDADGWSWLRPLPARLFLFSILTYATVWCGRRSQAERHNSRVNLHRVNSIRTIEAFRDAANAPATKDAVVLEAARAIFENVQTGDLGGSSSDGSPIAKTTEFVRLHGVTTKE